MSKSAATRKKILDAGLRSWPDVSSRRVGDESGLTHSAVLYHYPANSLRDAVAQHAIDVRDVRVLRFLFAEEHRFVDGLDPVEFGV